MGGGGGAGADYVGQVVRRDGRIKHNMGFRSFKCVCLHNHATSDSD